MARDKGSKTPPVRPVAPIRGPGRSGASDASPPKVPEKPSDAQASKFAAAIGGEPRDVLAAMRLDLATRLDEGVPSAYVVNVMRMLRDTDNAIRQLDEKAKAEADAERGERRTWNASAI
jgi:hypothetical protein